MKNKINEVKKVVQENKKVVAVAGIVTGVVILSAVAVGISQYKYNEVVEYSVSANATTYMAKYEDLGLLIKPDTIDKMWEAVKAEEAALLAQQEEILALETKLDSSIAATHNFNSTETTEFEAIKTEYATAKDTYNASINITTADAYIVSLTDLQARYDALSTANKTRLDKEAKAAAEKKAAEEAKKAEEEAAKAAESNNAASTGDSSSSNGSSGGDSSGSGSSDPAPSQTPTASAGNHTCEEIAADIGVTSIPECENVLEPDGIVSYAVSNDVHPVTGVVNSEILWITTNTYSYSWTLYHTHGYQGVWSYEITKHGQFVANGKQEPNYN